MRLEKMEKTKQKPKKKINLSSLFTSGTKSNDSERVSYPQKVRISQKSSKLTFYYTRRIPVWYNLAQQHDVVHWFLFRLGQLINSNYVEN